MHGCTKAAMPRHPANHLVKTDYYYILSLKTIIKGADMSSMDEQILRAAKEIAVKFIETGRVSPNGFSDAFKAIYQTVYEAVHESHGPSEPPKTD